MVVLMSAIEAFGKTIEFITRNPKLLLIPLLVALIMAPINAYMLKDVPMTPMGFQNFEKEGNVIIEEYGNLMQESQLMTLLKRTSISGLIELVIASIAIYALIKGALLNSSGEIYSLGSLLIEGTKKMPAVVVIRILINIAAALIAFMAFLPGILLIALGIAMKSDITILGVFLLLMVMLPVIGYVFTITVTAVPAYVIKGNMGEAFGVIGLAWRKKLSSLGFGLLLALAIILISIIPASFGGIAFLGSSGFIPQLVLQLVSAPFQALSIALQAIGGFMFYNVLQKEEEIEEEFDLEF
ncbi:hypothetical protein [Palaeococcus sp. (in: euryarchaeotes)]